MSDMLAFCLCLQEEVQRCTGEDLAANIRPKCDTYLKSLPQRHVVFPITTNAEYNLLFCPMCKLASTYWTKFFKMLEVYKSNKSINSPFDIPIGIAKPTRERLQLDSGTIVTKYSNYYKFMFVRNPYTRIISAYVDKIFAPNPTFWRHPGTAIIKTFRDKDKIRHVCGSDTTFEEYVRSIIFNHRKLYEQGRTDCHDESFTGACHPCELQLDFIGKMEKFSLDSNFLLKKLNLSRTIDTLNKHGKSLADTDAVMDTVLSPFRWKNEITSCVPWIEALKRMWRKLQIRGLIGKQQLPLTNEQANNINQQEFLDLIMKTQKETPYSERKKQQKEALIEIYSQVDMKYLKELRISYKNDFDFFEYDSTPSYIFNISRSNIQYYGYLDI